MEKLTPKNIYNTIVAVDEAIKTVELAIERLSYKRGMEYPVSILNKHKELLEEKLEIFENMDTEDIKNTIYDKDFDSLIRPTLYDSEQKED
ncbi:hypothetical protein [Clostridium botulinum]|uniref:hypothetical protein n=1 Tax=Clostridium botulinum TaxID=1491 RepID=UPI000773A53F|nr:hypothetical protein [Clostridium botulinum]MBY6930903.1 hypothetical protein [Clostridium botulinum]NFG21132.1 hypothetical protein [Clostridium botulinum]NFO80008.1 hypothetical protein [Clostridium botulinum]